MDAPAGWPFADPPNLATITTRSIMHDGAWIALVSHDEDDGGWQFLPAGPPDQDDATVVALRRVWERDPTVVELADLPLGWQAWRASPDSKWQRAPSE
jgi:hypothetical protein